VCFTRELISGLSSVNKLDFEEREREKDDQSVNLANQCPFRIVTAIFGTMVNVCWEGVEESHR